MNAKTLMIQGTTSDAGKSTIVAGLCRIFSRRGIRVAPFKPQNMALNSAVTIDGGEIGRAQALQAVACGIEPHSDMNPILLKPNSATGSQVIIQGKVLSNMDARRYHRFKPEAMPFVMQSFERLRRDHELIIVEGAGSPAEINLRDGDIANMGFAERADCPVLLVADIDRGGVFAHLIGTLTLLSSTEQERLKGFIINKFRGDPTLLTSGTNWLEQKTGKPTLGIVPLLRDFQLDAEDSLSRTAAAPIRVSQNSRLQVVVASVPSMSNHTDFDPLAANELVDLRFVTSGNDVQPADLVILPGSKSVLKDLLFLKANNWQNAIERHLRYGGKLIGICGGFQMLGETILDPLSIESDMKYGQGLQLLDIVTTFEGEKRLLRSEGQLNLPGCPKVSGYEIHNGVSLGSALNTPAVMLSDRNDGAMSEDGKILGTYFHGLFDEKESAEALMKWAGLEKPSCVDHKERRETAIEFLAEQLDNCLDMDFIDRLIFR